MTRALSRSLEWLFPGQIFLNSPFDANRKKERIDSQERFAFPETAGIRYFLFPNRFVMLLAIRVSGTDSLRKNFHAIDSVKFFALFCGS
ncbi:MAG: hypothetical protein WBK55_06505 [Alphaproteobacteria bacterium]